MTVWECGLVHAILYICSLVPGLPWWLFFGSTIHTVEDWHKSGITTTTDNIMRLQFECKSKGGAYVHNCDAFMQLGSSVPPTQDVWVYSTWLPLSKCVVHGYLWLGGLYPTTCPPELHPLLVINVPRPSPILTTLPLLWTHTRVKAGQVWEQG